MTYSLLDNQCAVFNWSNGETLNRTAIVDELNKKDEQLNDIYCWIDDKIDELEGKYEFGQKNGFCKMYNIRFAINTLKELQKVMLDMTEFDRYNENLDNVLKEYGDKSFKELMERADEIFDVLNNVEDLIAEVIEIQGVLTARLLKGDVE